jgi:hypothetical protein
MAGVWGTVCVYQSLRQLVLLVRGGQALNSAAAAKQSVQLVFKIPDDINGTFINSEQNSKVVSDPANVA